MTPAELSVLAEIVRRRSGVVIDSDKLYVIESRLAAVSRKAGYSALGELVRDLQQKRDETLTWAVVEALSSTETQFFRDRAPFEQVRTELLPALARRGRRTVRVWSAGCSTGQEPYSLAMLAEEEHGLYPDMNIEISACDLSSACLEKAQSGLYTQFEVQRGLPSRLLVKYFDKVEDSWQLSPRIRGAVQMSRGNLLTDVQGQGPFDIVFCRNVVSAFAPDVARAVLEQIAGVMAEDGYLVVGASEIAVQNTQAFRAAPGLGGLYLRDPAFRAAA